jgi:hypothetical protein
MKGSKIVSRLKKSKTTLEGAASCTVGGFRAPLLQHNFELIEGLKKADFFYDSSVPTFEPIHPRMMGPHGIGTIHPINVKGLLEVPITLIQDHQLLYTLGLKPKEVYDFWETTSSLIKSIGGTCVVLTHPEYQLFEPENIALYENYLNKITVDKDNEILTLEKLRRLYYKS